MPVYTVHGPLANGADFRSADRIVFARDGFHLWAAVFGPFWLAWHRLWIALIGWVAVMAVVDISLVQLGVGGTTIFFVGCLLALLLGFEAASLRRWTFSRRNWRQLDIVVADDVEAAERRFFERWSGRTRGNGQPPVDRGAPPPVREPRNLPPMPAGGIIGLFPEPGGQR